MKHVTKLLTNSYNCASVKAARQIENKAKHKHSNIFMQLCKCKGAKQKQEEAGE